MKIVYKLTDIGWIKVTKCQSFHQACAMAIELEAKTGIPHCVNN